VFLGTFTPRLDEKGRLVLPAKWRDELANGLVITRGQERSLRIDAVAEFTRITESLREDTPRVAKERREFKRMFFGEAHDEVPDRQGRVTIPTKLREYAGLGRDCTLIGILSYIEVWDTATWEQYQASREQAYSELSEDQPAPDS
jgi:MraZ protein